MTTDDNRVRHYSIAVACQ